MECIIDPTSGRRCRSRNLINHGGHWVHWVFNDSLMSKYKVAIFIGSASDSEVMNEAARFLSEMAVPYFMTVTSAHRSPARTRKLIAEMEEAGVQIFIVGAGGAAHLGGMVAAETTRPVVGV